MVKEYYNNLIIRPQTICDVSVIDLELDRETLKVQRVVHFINEHN